MWSAARAQDLRSAARRKAARGPARRVLWASRMRPHAPRWADDDAQRALVRRVQQGYDGCAARELVAAYLPLVRQLARRAAGAVTAEQLVAEGKTALLEAMACFDPAGSARFSTCAVDRVRARIDRQARLPELRLAS